MNVYQELIKVLKELDAPREAVYYCSQIAYELNALAAGGMTIQELAQYCIDNFK